MTFLQIRTRIAELMGISVSDITTDANDTIQAKLKAWVNARYKTIAGKRDWNWLIGDSIVQTVVDITTGTVSATNGSTAITFSSAPTISVGGFFIQFSDSQDWYQVSTHTASSTSAVLANAYLGANNAVLTYTVRKVFYALPSDAGKILDVRQSRVWNTKLRFIPARLLDRYFAYRSATATRPLFYSINGLDSNNAYRMEIFPVPSVAMNLNLRYYKVVTDLSADSDVPLIPAQFHEILVWDVLATYGYMFLDDTRVSAAKAASNEILAAMEANGIDVENIAVRLAYDIDLTDNSNAWLGTYNLPVQ